MFRIVVYWKKGVDLAPFEYSVKRPSDMLRLVGIQLGRDECDSVSVFRMF